MRLLVCGSRGWRNKDLICASLLMRQVDYIIAGGARGADSLAREVALDLGISYVEYRADWSTYGRSAGYVRNCEQYDKEQPDLVMAFHCDLGASKGTKHMIEYARSRGCPVVVVREDLCTCERVR